MDNAELARDFAKRIYELSEKAYMAHSIQAVKHYIRERKGNRAENFLLIVKSVDGFNAYTDKKSTAKVWPHKAMILVDSALGREQARMCIAHELFHVLLSMETFLQTASLVVEQPKRDRILEDCCDIFARDLCVQHDRFYADYKKVREFCMFTKFPKSNGSYYTREELGLEDKYQSEAPTR